MRPFPIIEMEANPNENNVQKTPERKASDEKHLETELQRAPANERHFARSVGEIESARIFLFPKHRASAVCTPC